MDQRRRGSLREGRCTVCGGLVPPFSRETTEVLSAFTDGTIDITEPAVWFYAPEAIQTILAERHGWDGVRGPGPLTWHEAKLSIQLLAEREIGSAVRREAWRARAEQDAGFDALKAAVGAR